MKTLEEIKEKFEVTHISDKDGIGQLLVRIGWNDLNIKTKREIFEAVLSKGRPTPINVI